ncbi:MAG: hypothetical protein ACLGHN_01195 [Bacteriovoracia bacterium]
MRLITAVTFMLLAFNIMANEADCNETTPPGLKPVIKVAQLASEEFNCSNPKKLRGLCMYVGDMEKDPNPQGRFVYKYQRKILEAACVDVNKDDEATIAKKIAKVWKENEDQLTCDNIQFDVVSGSIIKFAVSLKFDSFVLDMAKWKVNLNRVDKFDNRTVLDYVEYQIERMKGKPSEIILKNYYRILKDAGAKHKREL